MIGDDRDERLPLFWICRTASIKQTTSCIQPENILARFQRFVLLSTFGAIFSSASLRSQKENLRANSCIFWTVKFISSVLHI